MKRKIMESVNLFAPYAEARRHGEEQQGIIIICVADAKTADLA